MSIIMVPDPLWTGKGEAPGVIRSWAMRALAKQGMEVGDIARKYGVPYARAYRAVNPPRQRGSSPNSKATKPLTASRLKDLTKPQLIKIATQQIKAGDTATRTRVQSAVDELDRRDPTWLDNL